MRGNVFPTCVGINRIQSIAAMRGNVFPTCVGMNRVSRLRLMVSRCVPHMRGDEPYVSGVATLLGRCSPHAWG